MAVTEAAAKTLGYPLYLGYPTLVRGYDVNTFTASDCVANATSQCPAFDRLFGRRLLVGDVEFRFPLLRPFGASRRMYGPLPVELVVFNGGGVAWTSHERRRDISRQSGGVCRASSMSFDPCSDRAPGGSLSST